MGQLLMVDACRVQGQKRGENQERNINLRNPGWRGSPESRDG